MPLHQEKDVATVNLMHIFWENLDSTSATPQRIYGKTSQKLSAPSFDRRGSAARGRDQAVNHYSMSSFISSIIKSLKEPI